MKKVAVFNDISGFGKCSLAVSLPIISACGIECCPITTAVFTRQTAFEGYKYRELTDLIPSFIEDWKDEMFDGIYTGFFTNKEQIELADEFISNHKEASVVLVDPVLGDNGEAYPVCTDEIFLGIKELIKKATVITPNLTELSMLSGVDYLTLNSCNLENIARTARELLGANLKTIIVTGIHIKNKVCNIIVNFDEFEVVSSHMYRGSFSGTGDIFASTVAALTVAGKSERYAVKKAVLLISKAAKRTIMAKTDSRYGVEFERFLNLLK